MNKLVGLCFFVFASLAQASNSGMVFGLNTRVIFNLDEKATSFTLTNDTETDYLIQASIHEDDKERTISENFMVTPEVFRLKPNTTTNVTIRRLAGKFPDDRESLVYITGRWIPAGNKDNNGKVDLLYSFTQKVFVRPFKLNRIDAVDKSLEDVDFTYKSGQLCISNKSPYHLTFYRLLIDGKKVDLRPSIKMLNPFETCYLTQSEKPKKITWSFIGDSGYETATAERTLR